MNTYLVILDATDVLVGAVVYRVNALTMDTSVITSTLCSAVSSVP